MWGKGNRLYIVVATQVLSSPLETMLAKEAKDRFVLRWKTPRLSFWADRGLQYGLSGNRVLIPATIERTDQMGTACSVTAGSVW